MSSYRRYHDEKRDSRNNPRTNNEILEDLYRPEYTEAVLGELGYLVRSYGTQIRLGKSHPAPCSAWRAERSLQDTMTDWEARFANRVHLFAGARHLISNDDAADHAKGQTRRYLGYLSLRPRRYEEDKSIPVYLRYTAVAMLIPPPYMSRPRYHIITCISGSTDGVLPFRCTPFFSPASQQINEVSLSAPCMHATLHSALMLKASLFHCSPISSMEMVTLLWQMDHDEKRGERIREPIDGNRGLSFYEWLHKGLSLKQALAVLEHPAVRSGGVIEHIMKPSYLPPQNTDELEEETRAQYIAIEALRCLADYVANGIPVLLEVNTPGELTSGHAILVIGVRLMADPDEPRWPIPDDDDPALRRIDLKELPAKFIIHDTWRGPYELVSASYLLEVARVKPTTDDNAGEEGTRFLALLPIGARIGVQSVRDYVRWDISTKLYEPIYREYLESYSGDMALSTGASTAPEPRFICRLMRSRQLLRRYLRAAVASGSPKGKWPEEEGEALKDARAALRARLHRHQEEYDDEVKKRLEPERNKPDEPLYSIPLHWWCVEVRVPVQTRKQAAETRPADHTHQEVASAPPFGVYCWPINLDPLNPEQNPYDAPVKIEYGTGDTAELTLRRELFDPNEVYKTFPKWRPSDG